MAKGDNSRANKRKFGSGKGSPYAALPRRGPPAIFVTCESGRENKCQREALELMHHYYYSSREDINTAIQQSSLNNTHDVDESNDEQQPLSLEEELSLLRKGVMAEEVLTYERNSKRHKSGDSNTCNKSNNKDVSSSMKSPFSIYESGVRGMICILCSLPGCEVVPYDDIVAKVKSAKKDDEEDPKSSANNDTSEAKADQQSDEKDSSCILWDPVDTVKRIMEGVTDECNANNSSKLLSSAPSSRFITRMIPMQATVSYACVTQVVF